MLMHADKGLGENMTELSDKQMLDDTIIIFSTDNGGATSTNHHAVDDVGSSNFPLRGGKHALFEGGVHGVGVVWLGSRVEGGARLPREYDMIMGSVDWLPTLLAAAGVHDIPTAAIGLNERLGKPIDGVSHWEALLSLGQGVVPDRPRDSLFIGAAVGGYKFAIGLAMRSGKWKLIVNAPCAETQPHGWSLPNGSDFATQTDWPGYGDGTNLLFDLSVDPEERNECSRENQDVVQEIRMLLSEHQQSPYISRLLDIEDRSGMVGAPIRGVWGPWVYSNVLR
jgi:arylsulfatase A-like enzyme